MVRRPPIQALASIGTRSVVVRSTISIVTGRRSRIRAGREVMSDATRYHGKPFLRLLECFVLKAIGQLSEEHRRTLEQMAPKLRELYKRDGTWDEIVGAVMEVPPHLPGKIEEMWKKN